MGVAHNDAWNLHTSQFYVELFPLIYYAQRNKLPLLESISNNIGPLKINSRCPLIIPGT